MITVALLPSDAGGCGFYRVFQPLLELQRRGEVRLLCSIAVPHPDPVARAQGLVHLESVGHHAFPVIRHALEFGAFGLAERDAVVADVVIVQKGGGRGSGKAQELDLLAQIKAHDRKAIYEVDDALDLMTPDNPSYEEDILCNPGYIERARQIMKACHVVTCTTERLAEHLRRQGLPRVRVVPNAVDLPLWQQRLDADGWERLPGAPADAPAAPPGASTPPRVEGQVRVGWLASRNHVADSALLIKPFKALARRFGGRVKFVLAGGFYPELKRALGDHLEFHAGVSVDQLPALARWLRLDVAVAPLVGTSFDACKSALKMQEAAALGVPCVASYAGPYKDVEAFGGPRVRNANDWVTAIAELVEDSERRARVAAEQLRQVVARGLTVERQADALLDVLREVVAP